MRLSRLSNKGEVVKLCVSYFLRVKQLVFSRVRTIDREEGSDSSAKLSISTAVTVSLVDLTKMGYVVEPFN